MNDAQSKHQLAWIDNTKLWATLAVIGVHVSVYGVTTEYARHGQANASWWMCNFYESLFRCCVPLFVMITGALLLPQTIGLKDFLKKRLNRILLPFVFWSLIYMAFNLALKFRDQHTAALNDIGTWLYLQVINGPWVHLWYVYMIIGIYLFIPILQPWIKNASNKSILYFLTLWVVTMALKQLHIITADSSLDLRYFSGYIGYLVLGYYLANRVTIWGKLQYLAWVAFTMGFVITFIGTYMISNATGAFAAELYDFLTLNVFLLSFGAFVLIKSWPLSVKPTYFYKTRNIISKYGFGIYLSHPLVLNFMAHTRINYQLITPVIGIPISIVVCLTISCLLVYVLNKLPYGKHISG